MSKQTISLGTAAGDGTGTSLRVGGDIINDNFTELYNLIPYDLGEKVFNSAVFINDEDDLYSHDSIIKVINYGTKQLALIVYQCNKVTKTEYQTTQTARLIVYNLHTKAVIQSLEVAKAGETYGAVTLSSFGIGKIRMIQIDADTIRILFNCEDYIYYRDLDLATYTFGDAYVFQAKIRNAANDGWDGSAVDLTIANLSTHVQRCTGGDFAAEGIYNLIPVLGMDNILQVGSNYYMSCEAYYCNSGDYGVGFLMESTDLLDWKIYPPIAVDSVTLANNKSFETSFVYLNSKWRAISRANNYLYSESADGGLTWSAQVTSGLINPNAGSRTSAVYVNIQTGASTYYPIAFFAYNKDTEIYKATYGRTTMGIAITEDMQTFQDIMIMVNYRTCHYPAMYYFNGLLYLVFTTARATNTDRDRLMLAVINPYKQLRS